MKKLLLLLAGITITISIANAQLSKQTLRGKVIDKDSRIPLIGVSLVIDGSNPAIGTITDENGHFKFPQLETGRYDINVFYMGYEKRTIHNVLLNAGKESVMNIELTESVIKLNEVKITGRKHNGEINNKMATVSVRSFSVEETKRYAGSFADPGRMASAYAGVAGDADGENSIVIRGNSPRGLLWRLEGLEIPNPNHFAEEGATGGPISILNTNVLDNSDFFTGAFPAEYGNAYSGVFDIKLRKGNNEKREYSFTAQVLGTDMSLEGPFVEGKQSSYLFNYRYSTLAMLNAIGLKIVGDAVPKFQDMTFNFSFPTQKAGNFNLFGVGGISHINEGDDTYKNDFRTDMGVLGLSHTYLINSKTYIKSVFGLTGSKNEWAYSEFMDEKDKFQLYGREEFYYSSARLSSYINHKINARHTLRAGAIYSQLYYNLFTDDYSEDEDRMITDVDSKGNTGMIQSYANWRYRLGKNITFNTGVHYTQLLLNNNQTIEPRLGLKWQINPLNTFTAGFGRHSKIETLTNYLAQVEKDDGTTYMPNKNLELSKATHYVLGYQRFLNEHTYCKIELYYQDLFDVPVEKDSLSSFSALNHSYGIATFPLSNAGTGTNYGVEFTLERFFAKGFYYLITTSLYESKYKGSDGIERNSTYNGNYVLNILAGKEFTLGKGSKSRNLTVSLRGSWAGGRRYTPIDLEASRLEGHTVRDANKIYEAQRDPFIRYDLKLSLRKDKKKTTRYWELDIQNVTNQLNVAGDYYNKEEDRIDTWTQLGILPVLGYRIEF